MHLRRWMWLAVAALALTRAGAAPEPDDRALLRLFPKPPVAVLSRVAVAGATAVLYRMDRGGLRLGLVTGKAGGGWELRSSNLKAVEMAGPPQVPDPPRLTTRELLGVGRPALLLEGRDRASGRLLVMAVAEDQLTTVAALDFAPELPPEIVDLDQDGTWELLARSRDEELWPGGPGLAIERVTPWRFGGGSYAPEPWRHTGRSDVDEWVDTAGQLAAAHLFTPAAAQLAEVDRRLHGGPSLYNQAVLRRLLAPLQEQVERYSTATTRAGLCALAVAQTLVGDYHHAAETLLAFDGPGDLPVGWDVPWRRLAKLVDQVPNALPAMGDDAGYVAVRGFVALAGGNESAARASWTRAGAINPSLPHLEPWRTVVEPLARLWFIAADGVIQVADLSAAGRLTAQVTPLPELGRARALSGRPDHVGVAWVTADGRELRWTSDGRTSRLLLRGEFLSLAAEAVSPDGQRIAVDEGTSVVRRLHLVTLAGGQVSGTLTYAGSFVWSPDSRRLAADVARDVTPPLPWEDGGTRDVALFDLSAAAQGVAARGDATTLWTVEQWLPGQALVATRQALRINPNGDAQVASSQRYALEPEADRMRLTEQPSLLEEERRLVAQRTPAGDVAAALGVAHPRLLAWRLRHKSETLLVVSPREGHESWAVAPLASLDRPLSAAWALPGANRP